jgi:hypothetical protein
MIGAVSALTPSRSQITMALVSGGVVVVGLVLAVAIGLYPIHQITYFLGLVLAAVFYVRASGGEARRHVLLNLAFLVLVLVLNYLYGVSNQPIGTVHSVKADFDSDVPVIPEFAVPYLLFYAFIPFTIALVGAQALHRQLTTLLVALSLSMAVALLTFVVFQTYVPPPDPSEYGAGPFRAMVAYIEHHLYAGHYYSAFPSEHCGYATILAIAVWRAAGRGWAVFGVILGVATVLATQFLHQHYVMDAIYGVALAIAAYAVAWWLSESRARMLPSEARLQA